ncbi:MAG: hypothetical protein P8045_08190 [Candidatus Thiodiazotropha sp.]
MNHKNRNYLSKSQDLLLSLVAVVLFTANPLVFAENAQAATSVSGDKSVQASDGQRTESIAGDDAKPVKLKTKEEIYAGMLEAEKRKIEAGMPDPAIDNRKMVEQWGVEVLRVSYAADGFWLEFRFRVHDPEKANVLFDTKMKPYMESEASGVKLAVPTAAKVGALRTTNRGHNIKAGKIYNIMFSNPGFLVQPGQKVTVVSGDFKAEHLTVRGEHHNLEITRSPESESQ